MSKKDQLPKISPEELKNFDVVRVRHNDQNTTAVVMKKLYVPNSDKVASLVVYLISPEHNPTAETRQEAKSQRDKICYVHSEPYKAKMGLDPKKDYRIALNMNGIFITSNMQITRLGSLAITDITKVLTDKFSSEMKSLQPEKQKQVLDASTQRRLQGHSTFDYSNITSSTATHWSNANASTPSFVMGQKLEPTKLKKKKEVPIEEPKPSGPGSLFSLYQEVVLKEQTPEPIIDYTSIETKENPVPVIEEATSKPSGLNEEGIFTNPPDVSLTVLFEKGMISKTTQNAFARNADKGFEPVHTLVEAFNFFKNNNISMLPSRSKKATDVAKYEIFSVAEDLMGFEI